MDTCTTRNACMSHLLLIPPYSIPSICHLSLVTSDTSKLSPLLNETSGGQDSQYMYVNNFVTGCSICQQNKVRTHPIIPPISSIKSTSNLPFKQLLVDLITDLPLSQGYDSLMVMVDHGLTNGVILAPCSKTIDANRIAQLFFNHVFKQFGLHDMVISDCGPQFASTFARELAWILKYDICLSTAYHPQMDGQTKPTNQEVETIFRSFVPIILINGPNSSLSLNSNTTRFPIARPRSLPSSFSLDMIPTCILPLGKPLSQPLKVASLPWTLPERKLWQHMNLSNRMEQSSRKFSPWKVGDKVWLEATNLWIPYPSRKLVPKRHGPFEISQVLSPLTYKLHLLSTWKIQDVFHATHLSSYCQMEAHGPSFSRPPPDLIDTKEEYKADHIVSHKDIPGQRLYLTAWKGYPSSKNTWEPENNLRHAPMLLSEYKRTHEIA